MNDFREIDPRERRRRAVPGVIAASLSLPILLAQWAPTSWVLAWMIAYLVANAFGILNPCKLDMPTVDTIWAVTIGFCFALFPIFPALAGEYGEARWAVYCVVGIYIAIETAMLPHLVLRAWKIGPIMAMTATVVAHVIWGGFAVSEISLVVAFLSAMMVVLIAGDDSRERNLALIAETRKAEAETSRAQNLALHDSLTSVLNRRGITEVIDAAVLAAPATVIMFDADGFKSINDTAGHAAGDRALIEIANALVSRLGPHWSVGRLGGDEFVAVLSEADSIPPRIVAPIAVELPRRHGDRDLTVRLSAGSVTTTAPATTDQVLARAGFALGTAKRSGAGVARFEGELAHRWVLSHEVTDAVTGTDPHNRIVPYAQIILRDDTPVGCEILARWHRGDSATLPPSEFIPLLASSGAMPGFNRLMIESAIAFAARFNDHPHPPFVSVNVPASHLASPDLVGHIASLLRHHRVSPRRLMIEITESERLTRVESRSQLHELRRLGLLIAIDDLGAGYSSIERMTSLPISHLKFDHQFTQRINEPLGEVMRGFVAFAQATEVTVIAEGVETLDHQLAVKALGIECLQGFLFHRPEPLDQVERLILGPSEPRDPASSEGPAWSRRES